MKFPSAPELISTRVDGTFPEFAILTGITKLWVRKETA